MLPVSSVPEEFDEIKKQKYYNIKYTTELPKTVALVWKKKIGR